MGKKIRVQRRGRGSPTFRASTHKRVAKSKYPLQKDDTKGVIKGKIEKIDSIFSTIGLKYKKREEELKEIISKIDFNYLINDDEVSNKINSFHYFYNQINECFI